MLTNQPRFIFVSFQAQQIVYVFAISSKCKPTRAFLHLKSNLPHPSHSRNLAEVVLPRDPQSDKVRLKSQVQI